MSYTPIDLAALPPPNSIEPLDFETILAASKARLIEIAPELAQVLQLESGIESKILELWAYIELIQRARVNDSIRAVHLASASGADLDALAAIYDVQRLTVLPADPESVPPVAAVMESDTALRLRTQMALEGLAAAGPIGAYEVHARAADGRVRDVAVTSPAPGTVLVSVLSHEDDGVASYGLLDIVRAALGDDVRPLCDHVIVARCGMADYSIVADLTVVPGPAGEVAMQAARDAASRYVEAAFAVGQVVRRSAIYAALHQAGVTQVELWQPTDDVLTTATEAPRCAGVLLEWTR